MHFEASLPLNAAFVKHRQKAGAVTIISPGSHRDPHMKLGSHLQIVQRVWDEIGGVLSADCRAIVYGSPVLVDPHIATNPPRGI